MTDHLRSIALTVDEPEQGVFHWVLLESTEDASVYGELTASEESFPSYDSALQAGVEALRKYSADLRRGPRAAGEDEDASPVNEPRRNLAVPMTNAGFADLPDEYATGDD